MNEMIEGVVDGLVNIGSTVLKAREYAETVIPTLKRWKIE